jgi:hypothetical protein
MRSLATSHDLTRTWTWSLPSTGLASAVSVRPMADGHGGAGRPPGKAAELRRYRVPVSLTDAERAALERIAKAKSVPVAIAHLRTLAACTAAAVTPAPCPEGR